MRKLNEFGLCVKTKLLHMGNTQEWLIEKVKADTGMFLDSAYLTRILNGERNPTKIISSISKVLEIES